MPLPTRNPGALITTVGGVPSCRIAVYVNSIAALQPAVQVRTAARQGEWWWKTRARKVMSSGWVSQGQGWSSGGCSPLISYLPTRIIGSHFAIVHWPSASALTKVPPAQVARAARSAATSQLARPTCSARTAPRYGEAPPMIWSRRTFEVQASAENK